MDRKAKDIVVMLFSCIALLYLYTFLHEGGHALIAIICGGKVDKMVLGLNAHVQKSGVDFTPFSEALFSIAGALLPVIFMIIALAFYKVKVKNTYYHFLYGISCIGITSSLLAWVIVPLIALFAFPPAGDDATKFLDITGIHPLAVAFITLLTIAALVFFIFKKGLPGKIKEIYGKFPLYPEKRRKNFIIRLGIGIALGVCIVIYFNMLSPQPVLKTSFSVNVNAATDDAKLPFTVEKGKLYNMDLKLSTKGILTDVQIYNDKGIQVYQNICERFTLSTPLPLEKGKYEFVLRFLKDPAGMEEYFEERGYRFKTDDLKQLKSVFNTNSQAQDYLVTFSAVIK